SGAGSDRIRKLLDQQRADKQRRGRQFRLLPENDGNRDQRDRRDPRRVTGSDEKANREPDEERPEHDRWADDPDRPLRERYLVSRVKSLAHRAPFLKPT